MQVSRPLTMKKEGIQTRKRKPKVASSSNSSGGSSSSSNVHQSGDKSSSKSQWFFFMGFFFPHPIPSIALINDSRERERSSWQVEETRRRGRILNINQVENLVIIIIKERRQRKRNRTGDTRRSRAAIQFQQGAKIRNRSGRICISDATSCN